MLIGSYTLLHQLAESDTSRLYVGTRPGSDSRFILKSATDNVPADQRELAVRNEHEITLLLHGDDVTCEVFRADGQIFLARTYFEGVTLGAWAREHQPDLAQKLAVAQRIAHQLAALHVKKLLHQDLSPANILVETDGATARLIDYNLSARLDRKAYYVSSAQKLEGTLAYMAPEQTGRMNRTVDYRADLYALGVILFELLSGQLPFTETEPLEIIHRHLASKPPHLHAVRPELPPVLDEIVQKLLNKNAEDRYQSAISLEADLAHCEEQLRATGQIPAFALAALDQPLDFRIPEKLYGREAEAKALLHAFGRAAAGKKMLVTIGGYSGVGKSRLVHDINIPVTLRQGYFISGKFDLIQRTTPYLAWVQAIEKFVEIVLAEDRAVIESWKQRILAALGQAAGVITNLVPAVEQIIGRQSLLEGLTVSEDSNRFNYALRQFIKAICTEEHPLVIFLDDMQWADRASLHLLRLLLTEPGLGYLLLITAYRDNEVSAAHPFVVCLEESEAEWRRVNDTDTSLAYAPDHVLTERVTLHNLRLADVRNLVGDTFKNHSATVHALADVVYAKTKGNSFFIHQFLGSLYEDGLVELVRRHNQLEWEFDLDKITASSVTDNVVDLMDRQIGKLPAATIRVLELASCLGYEFELHDLAAVARLTPKQTEQLLFAVLEADYILPLDAKYKFVEGYEHEPDAKVGFRFTHDKIAQLFQARLSDGEKQQAHANIFHLLHERSQADADAAGRIFELAGHLGNAGALIEDATLKRTIYFAAGLKAKASSAFSLAYTYLTQAIDASGEALWQTDYPLMFRLHLETAETAYQSGLYAETEKLTAIVTSHARTTADAARGLEVLIDAYFLQQRFQDAVNIGVAALRRLDVKLPKATGKLDVITEFLKTNWLTRNFNPEDLLTLGEIKDEAVLPVIRLMTLLLPPAFFSNPNLFVVLVLRLTVLTVQKGISTYGTHALANYAYMLCAVGGKIPRGIAFGNSTLRLLERPELRRYTIRTRFSTLFFVEQYQTNLYHTLSPLKDTFKEGLEAGDSDFTAFAGNAYVQHAIIVGANLTEISVELLRQLQYCIQTRNENSLVFTKLYFQYVACLQGDAPDKAQLNGKYFDSAADLQTATQTKNLVALFNFHWYQGSLCFYYGQLDEAVTHLDQAKQYREMVLGTPLGNYLPFMEAIYAFSRWLRQPAGSSPAKTIKASLKPIENLAKYATADFQHKSLFAQAMLRAVAGDQGAALSGFEAAVRAIDANLNRHDKALCLLVYARYCEHLQLPDLAMLKGRESARLFAEMGANAVSDFIEGGFGGPRGAALAGAATPGAKPASSGSVSHQGIDMFSVLKSTQVIASEFELDSLIKKLLPLMIENAGAEKGVLLLTEEDKLRVSAVADTQGAVELLADTTIEDYPISRAIVNYVVNSGTPVILDHAHLSGRFLNDPYIIEHKVRSLLCVPITHKGKLTGVLYLENNMVSGAFTQGRIDVLSILATQAAISIENAVYFKHVSELNSSYERFVPQSFLGQLEKKSILDIVLGNQVSKEMTVLFADIRGFTTIAEKLSPAEVFTLLNEVWAMLSPIIDRHEGIIDKYIGDAVMALFPADGVQAVRAAVEMQQTLNRFNIMRQKQGLFALNMGIGVNSGPMILGTVGSETRLNTTVIGDAVNVASRLESLCRGLGAKILLSGPLADSLPEIPGLALRTMGRFPLKGKAAGIIVVEEFSAHEPALRQAIQAAGAHHRALVQALDGGTNAEAAGHLNQYAAEAPADLALEYYRGRVLAQAETVG